MTNEKCQMTNQRLTHCSFVICHCSLLIVHCSLFIAHLSFVIAHCSFSLCYNLLRFTQRTLIHTRMFPLTANVFWMTRLGVMGLLAITVACTSTPPVTPPVTATPSLPSTAPDTLAPTATAVAPVAEPITLTLWLSSEFSAEPARQILSQQLSAFAANEDGAPTRVLIKNDHGPGGLFDLLKTASPVAPRSLPDLIALDAAELEPAARAGLLQPIGPQLPADLITDLFPFARELGTINQTLYGLVYRADLEHLAYNTRSMDTAPIRWREVLSSTKTYVFAVYDSSGYVSDALLAQYLALGGRLVTSDGQPALDQTALTALLQAYQQAQAAGVLAINLNALTGPEDVWTRFQNTNAALVNVRASQYMNITPRFSNAQFAALPAFDRPIVPIGRGWVLALVAREPRRQAAARRLLQWLISPENNGALTQAEQVLPGRSAALSTWNQADPYTGFIREQLTLARAAPPASILNIVGPPLRKAVEDVLAGRATPAEAAQTAVAVVGTPKP
jgi:ABC-type glycerol-3-phosphate transport system substrate-binding protein